MAIFFFIADKSLTLTQHVNADNGPPLIYIYTVYIIHYTFTQFTFMHLADAFIQSNLQCIQVIHLYCQYVCSLGIEPTTFMLLTQCSNHTEPQEDRNSIIDVTKTSIQKKSLSLS